MNLQAIDEFYPRTLLKEPHELIRQNLRPTLEHPNFTATAVQTRRLISRHMAKNVGRSDISQLSTLTLHLAIIYYHCHRKITRENSSKTISTVKEYVESTAIASGRQVSNIVSRLIDYGRIVREPSSADKRFHWLVPTPAMIKTSIDYCVILSEPLQAMGLSRNTVERLKIDPNFQEALLYHMCRLWISGCDCILPFKVQRRMGTKSRGLALTVDLVLHTSEAHGTIFEEKPIPFNVKTLADTLRVSRSHLRLLLDDLQRSGDLRIDYGQRELVVTRQFAVASECSMAAALIMTREALKNACASPLLEMTG